MTLHIFNPEHDIALAANLENFTAPHAGRQLRHDLGFLPVLWADGSDVVLVEDESLAEKNLRKLCQGKTIQFPKESNRFQGRQSVCSGQVTRVEPWGWDLALRSQLLRMGISESLLPTKEQLAVIRQLSHRRLAAETLQQIVSQGNGVLTGEAFECKSVEEVRQLMLHHPKVVLKAPWSSSGRGIRFVSDFSLIENWLHNLLTRQGSVMLEPYYNKVKDFGMEFYSDGKGRADFLGLSLFHTTNGAYTGNILATETFKQEMLGRYVSVGLLRNVSEMLCRLLGDTFANRYEGPFGVDMMIVAAENGDRCLLHPCVEINLRRTMGHVALTLGRLVNPRQDDELVRVMRIVYEENNYKLKIQRL